MIIEGIRQQDDKILSWIYSDYHQTVRHHVLKNSGSEDDVSDVFQETIITLYRQITEGKLNLTTDLKGYFFSVARNIWNVQLRRKRRNIILDTDLPDDNENEDSKIIILEKIISRVFQKLKPDAQTILKLYAEGKTYEEITSIMNLKNETYARRKKYLSKEALIELIKEDHEYKDYLDLK